MKAWERINSARGLGGEVIIVRRSLPFDDSIRNVSAIGGSGGGRRVVQNESRWLSDISREESFQSRLALTHAWSIHHQQAERSYWRWAVSLGEDRVFEEGVKTSTVFGFEQPLAQY